MDIIQAILLGVVQGITEFLPISSSGHLVWVPELFSFEPGGLAFDTMVHLATFLAVVVVFWGEIMKMAKGMFMGGEKKHGKLGWMIVVGTIPVVVVGLLFADQIDMYLRNTAAVAISLIIWGFVLGAADLYSRVNKPKVKKETKAGWGHAVTVGLAQVISLIPGTSRSGITMSAGLMTGMDRKTAARFSFLLSIPAVGGAAAYVIWQSIQAGVNLYSIELLGGFVGAFVAGMLAIRFLLGVIERWSFMPFALYRILLGGILLLTLV